MASRSTQYKYKIKAIYLDQKNNKSFEIKKESIKFLIIDHNYEVNCMPILYMNISLDKKLIDHMLLNYNDNLITLSLSKYDILSGDNQDIECFRKKFIYFIPNDVNKNDIIDYNGPTEEEHLNNTYVNITIGLLCLDHINNNKKSFNFILNNVNINEPVNKVVEHFDNLIMEPIGDASKIPQLLIKTQNSVNKTLSALNKEKVFYNTKYRFYQDFNYTYLISSSGRAIKKDDDIYTSIIVEIEDILSKTANDVGIILNKTSETYQMPINYANTQVYDNSLSNKSVTELVGMTNSGDIHMQLNNQSSYLLKKQLHVEVDDERELSNIKSSIDNNNFHIFLQKQDLDTDVFTINKRITVHNIDRYKEHNGDYLMYRKREYYIREDDYYLLDTLINLKEISH